jgi:hypothetical protein
MIAKENKNWHCNNCKAELATDKEIEEVLNND